MRYLVSSCFLFTILLAKAQFQFEVGASFQQPSGEFAEGYDIGLGVFIEPSIGMDKLAFGLHAAAMTFGDGDINSLNGTSRGANLYTAVLMANYKLIDSGVSPYVGGGLGLYDLYVPLISPNRLQEIGTMARGGLLLGRLDLQASFHMTESVEFLQFSIGVILGTNN